MALSRPLWIVGQAQDEREAASLFQAGNGAMRGLCPCRRLHAVRPSGQGISGLHRFPDTGYFILFDGRYGRTAKERCVPVRGPGAFVPGQQSLAACADSGAALLFLQYAGHE